MLKKNWKDSLIASLSTGTGWTLALVIMWVGLVLHLWLAAHFPLSNDESYYWDWGQNLQLSYYDHPPGISWVTAINAKLASGLLAVRFLIPFLHALAAFFLLLCLREIHPQWRARDFLLLSAATVLVPGFGLLGIFALPDAGLYPCITAALWLTLRYRRKERLGAFQGISWGIFLGLAGLFKYHALPIGAGLGLSLLWLRRKSWRQDLTFWLSAIGFGLLMTTPLWIWNIQNDWASIRYQTRHGMGDLRWQPEGGLRLILGLLIFVTPWFAVLMFSTIGRLAKEASRLPRGTPLILLSASLPLLLLVGVISFFKPILLHWMMPGLWLLLPAVVALYGDSLIRAKRSWVLAAILSVLLPSLLASRDFRRNLLTVLDEKAGPLMELTMWTELNLAVHSLPKPLLDQPSYCPREGYLAGQRWYIVSQLHFLNKLVKPTISLDRNNPSYYSFRDANANWVGCVVTLVIPEKNYRKEFFQDLIEIERVSPVPLHLHASQKYLAVFGRLIAPPPAVLQPPTRTLHAQSL